MEFLSIMEDVKVEYRGYNLHPDDYVVVNGNVNLTRSGYLRVKSINKKLSYESKSSNGNSESEIVFEIVQ